MSKKTKIICTIGPASESKEVLTKLVEAGMNIARLNFSHGDYEEHAERVKRIREVSKETGKPIGILLDTKGPEIRLGDFENGGCEFAEGDEIDLVKEEVLGNHERFTLRCPEVFNDVQVGDYILMDDGKMKVTFTEVTPDRIHGVVNNPHFLKSRKGCNLPGIKLSMPFISEKDEADIRFGCKMDVDYIAASFTNDAIGISVADTALAIDIKCIIAFTQSGNTVRRLAKFRPCAPILGITFDEVTQRSLLPVNGVTPVVSNIQNTKENDIDLARNLALQAGFKTGDHIIVVAGYPVGSGNTNMMRIAQI